MDGYDRNVRQVLVVSAIHSGWSIIATITTTSASDLAELHANRSHFALVKARLPSERSALPHKRTVNLERGFNVFSSIQSKLTRFLRSEDGPTAVEYAVILALIVGACLAAVQSLATATADSFDASSNAIEGAIGP